MRAIVLLLAAWGGLTVFVQRESVYRVEPLAGQGSRRALVLFHPSREARFSDELSMAFAAGLREAGFSVDRATLTAQTPGQPQGYEIIAVVSNTYNWAPDWPTQRYLKRARLDNVTVAGLIGGAGSTGRSERLLAQGLEATGAKVVGTRSFWLWRPNDESRMNESNREVAANKARSFALEVVSSAP